MKRDFKIEQLDKTTLEFAIETAWQFEFMCKNTKDGRTQALAYSKVQNVLQHYLQELDKITLDNTQQ